MTDPVFNKPIPQGIESTVGYYIVSNAFTGGALNDILEKKIAIDVSTSSQSQSKATLLGVYYVNLTQGTLLQDSEVLAANITYIGTTTGGGGVASHVIVDSSALPTGAATSANQTNGNQLVKLTDGTDTAEIKPASTAPLATDPALVIAISPNSPAIGTVAPATAPTNAIVVSGFYSSSTVNLTNGQSSGLLFDVNSRLLVSTPFSIFPATVVLTQALTNTAFQIKSSSGRVVGWNFINPNATAVYIKFYNALAVNVTVGTTTPVKTLFIAPTSSSFVPNSVMVQHNFTTAISIAVVTGIADSDNTAPATNCYGEVHYA